MVKRMLIDATHPEETRVVVVNGTRLEELDVETSTKKQIKGNIYLAKVIRVEPSLQAAFVDYGGNRHGFLAFSEIHPDYFQIPAADRQALLAAQRADVQEMAAESARREAARQSRTQIATHTVREADDADSADGGTSGQTVEGDVPPAGAADAEIPASVDILPPDGSVSDVSIEAAFDGETGEEQVLDDEAAADSDSQPEQRRPAKAANLDMMLDEPSDQELERRRARLLRNYKIQEVIKRRQIMLVQVVKEERGNKGAALTTYLSLAGRYCVLMPNTARGGGVSRKITNTADRRRLKTIAGELECPDGMAVIVRTAGSERSRTEIRRDYEYLLRAWESVRDLTLRSSAPACVYEEASLIKRSIRDLYTRDIDEVLVDGDEGYRLAKDYMRMLTPSHAKKVQPYKDPVMPMFQRYQVEAQLDAMHSPVVQLRSGGYIVIGQTEALVAIDVNSGRATKERHIEETAVKTNLEAAEEIARQLRLRDLAGLIVIDFIDMEENRNNNAVERRLKDALKSDRARIQVGKISSFGLLELSRQRLRPSLQETSFTPCPHCAGTGMIRSVESSAMHVLRAIEEEGIRRRTAELTVFVSSEIALYILNHKRDALSAIEERYQFDVFLQADNSLIAPNVRMERVRAEHRPEEIRPVAINTDIPLAQLEEEEAEEEDTDSAEDEDVQGQDGAEGDADSDNRRRRRRRRRKRRGGQDAAGSTDDTAVDGDSESPGAESEEDGEDGEDGPEDSDADGDSDSEDGEDDGSGERRKRRRGRRGGRRRRGRGRDAQDGQDGSDSPDTADSGSDESAESGDDQASSGTETRPDLDPPAVHSFLTPRSLPDAVADVFEQAEQAELARLAPQQDSSPEMVTATADSSLSEESVAVDQQQPLSAGTADDSRETGESETRLSTDEKPTRRRTRKKAADGEDSADDAGEETAPARKSRSRKKPAEAAEGQDAAETAEDDKPSRKRTRKPRDENVGDDLTSPPRKRPGRKSKASVEAEAAEAALANVEKDMEPQTESQADAPAESAPVPAAEPAPSLEVVQDAAVTQPDAPLPSGPAAEESDQSEPLADTATPGDVTPAEPPAPPRRGWWSKP